ncbi:MAG TPA: flavodoxin domain-containing protein [Nitrososphaerales archaeon]|nr:flavodoxin domain-containing protein [Nitrososphaerales archaeon]
MTLRVENMRGIVVYDTSYGNTAQIAEIIADTLNDSGVKADLCRESDIKNPSAKDYEFVIVGSPTRFGTMSFAIRGFLGRLKGDQWIGKPFTAFDTENPENAEKKQGSAAEKIAQKLLEKKMTQLSPVLKSLVIGMRGPLVEGEVERTRTYAKSLAVGLKGLSTNL